MCTAIERIVNEHRLPEPVYITRPNMPLLNDYIRLLEEIWQNKYLTNQGKFHKRFEASLAQYLGQKHVSLFCNGTVALLVALQALRITSGEVITTPFTFPATSHVLYWNRITPVFCDIDPETLNIDSSRIEELITPDTRAILGVHVYGTPCDVQAIRTIAKRHGLKVIYDAAHAFGTFLKGRSVAGFGDISMLSFHATKPFSTAEGGALVTDSSSLKHRIDSLKNFGIAGEEKVIGPGINGKMSEFSAAYGLLQMEILEEEMHGRAKLASIYRENLRGIPGLTFLEQKPELSGNDAYFPILVTDTVYGMSRDDLCDALRRCNIVARKYFYPLCSRYSCYSRLPSARPEFLPVAERVSKSVLCLPLYGTLGEETVRTVCEILSKLNGKVVS